MATTVLVVDDDAASREMVCTVLEYEGYKTCAVRDGAAALHAMDTVQPDVVLSDILMPTMDGYELVRAIRADSKLRDTPVVFYTAFFVNTIKRAEANDLEVETIVEKVGDVLALVAAVAGAVVAA